MKQIKNFSVFAEKFFAADEEQNMQYSEAEKSLHFILFCDIIFLVHNLFVN